jgi:hypothetical protein
MVGANSTPPDPSARGVRIIHLTTELIFAAASLYPTPECAEGRTQTCAADVYAFVLILFFMVMVCQRVLARHAAHEGASGRNRDPNGLMNDTDERPTIT